MSPLLAIHVTTGGLGLLSGLIQLILKKSGSIHRWNGRFYLTCMLISSLTAIGISGAGIFNENSSGSVFLFAIGWFTLYLLISGYVHARYQSNPDNGIRMMLIATGMTTASGMVALAMFMIITGMTNMGIVLLVFGLVLFLLTRSDHRVMLKVRIDNKTDWRISHLGRMIASYIAATTAFLVNVIHTGPDLLKWLGPSVLGTLLINRYARKISQ